MLAPATSQASPAAEPAAPPSRPAAPGPGEADAPASQALVVAAPPLRPVVLVVDDEPELRRTIGRIARLTVRNGADIVTAATPQEARAAATAAVAGGRDLLVLSDFNLGSCEDGLSLLAEFAELEPRTRRVLISGYPREDFTSRAEFRFVHAFLPKPFGMDKMAAVFREFMARDP